MPDAVSRLKVRDLWKPIGPLAPLGVPLDAQCWSEDGKHFLCVTVITGSTENGAVVWKDNSGNRMFPLKWMLHGEAESLCAESDPSGVRAIVEERL